MKIFVTDSSIKITRYKSKLDFQICEIRNFKISNFLKIQKLQILKTQNKPILLFLLAFFFLKKFSIKNLINFGF